LYWAKIAFMRSIISSAALSAVHLSVMIREMALA